jgi:4-hydroxythreonine-4-phosphate dehydrogenase
MLTLRIAVTPGEPAGIGPDICLQLAQLDWPCELVFIADHALLARRAKILGLALNIQAIDLTETAQAHIKNTLKVFNVPLRKTESAGVLNKENANYVLETLTHAVEFCMNNTCAAVVTAPVQKSIINDAGINFSGHTEFFADYCNAYPVMMLTADTLRVALATTHIPLRDISDTLTPELLSKTIIILNNDLIKHFNIPNPRIAICGLNPHAGEGGHLGDEEINVITPVITALKNKGLKLTGPLPADTVFTQAILDQHDAVLAMFHDQGLPTLKYAGFGNAVNVTLGLPIIRTSVDHGTALSLAGSGQANSNSLTSALNLAIELASKNSHA